LQFSSSGGADVIYGIDPKSFRDVSGGFVFLEGHDMQGPDDILLDDWAAKANHATVNGTVHVLDHEFHVAGIVDHGKGARLFVPLSTLQDLSGARDKASVFFIKCTRSDHTQAVMDEMRPIFQGYQIRPLKDYLSLMSSANLPGLDAFIESMIALAVTIGFLVILLSMYTTVIERTRDIGVLKSLGASKAYIIRALLSESAFICVIGIGVGIAFSYIARALFLSSFPTLSILITPEWIVRSALIALAGGLLGASYPAWMASRKDAIEALSYD
jgi:putative ABC transport system permease protein